MNEAIAKAQMLVQRLRQRYGNVSAEELAHLCGVEIVSERWEVAGGRLVYFGECTREPLRIMLNEAALESAVQREPLRELVIAHELGHLLLPRPSIFTTNTVLESAAHAFAQAWMKSCES